MFAFTNPRGGFFQGVNELAQIADSQAYSALEDGIGSYVDYYNKGKESYKKTQEVSTLDLFKCYKNIYNKNFIDLSKDLKIENCRTDNISNILKEFHKRITIPLYIPALMLICLLVITKSKENNNYTLYRFKIFLIGLVIIILSELSIRYVETNIYNNAIIFLIPLIIILYLYLTFYFKFNFKENKV